MTSDCDVRLVSGQEGSGFERRHAASAGRGDRLTPALVPHIAAGKDTGIVVCVRARLGDQVAGLVDLKLAVEEGGVGTWPMA